MIIAKATQAELLAALQSVAGVIERRHTLPILANVLLRKRGAEVEFIGSDLEIQIRTSATLGGDDGDMSTTVSARKLVEILRTLPPTQAITLSATGQRLTVQGGKSRFQLQMLPAEDFPLVTESTDARAPFSVPQKALKALIQQVHFAMAVHDIRYYLNGILFVADGSTLTVVATDGHRLAVAQREVEGAALARQEVILPRKTVLELQRLLSDIDEPIEMRFSSNQARFAFNGLEFVSKLVEGKFPDYQRVIPKSTRWGVTMGREPLLASLQRTAILTSEKFKGVRLNFEPGALRLAASNAEQEEAQEELEVDYTGEPLEIGFNVAYLIDALVNTPVEMVRLDLQDGNTSALMTIPDQPGFKYVVMPMRI